MTSEQFTRIARQHLQTSLFLGIDFVPVRLSRDDSDETNPGSNVSTDVAPAGHVAAAQSAAAESSAVAEKQQKLAELRARHDATCPHCTKVDTHTQTVFGEGNPDAALMFVGEAPGEEEDRTGRPFVGRAGQKLDQIIAAMGLSRDDVYIANVLKSRPPNNRTPLQHEVDACSPFLAEQIRIIQPQVIVTLGGPATKLMLTTDVGITRLRGQWASYQDPITNQVFPVMPTFHPAYLLRNYTAETRRQIWSDMQAVLGKLSGLSE